DLVHVDLSPVEIGQLLNFRSGLDASNDLVTLAPNPDLTLCYSGPGGASYINLTATYRASVRGVILNARVAAERAEIAVYNAGAPAGSGGRGADLPGPAGSPAGPITNAPRVAARPTEAGGAAPHTAAGLVRVLGLPAE